MKAYQKFASIYDELMYDCDYEKWSQYLIKAINERVKTPREGERLLLADLACGSGNMTMRLRAAGFDVFGVDSSVDMLNVAREKAQAAGYKIDYLCQDITIFSSIRALDCVTMCLGASYLSKKALDDCFLRVYASLKEGGVFIFDISSEYKIKEFISNNVFYEDSDDITYLWTNKLHRDRVDMSLAFFVRDDLGKYERFDELHTLYIHRAEDLKEKLLSLGFSSVELFGDTDLSPRKEKDMRAHFICVK